VFCHIKFEMSESTSTMIRGSKESPLCGSVTSSNGTIKDFWGVVVVPSSFVPSGGGKTIFKQAVRLPHQNCY